MLRYAAAPVDVDGFITTNRAAWERLAWLSTRGRRRRALDPEQLDELVHLYQRVAGHLSHARVAYHDPALTIRLTQLVADANAVLYGKRADARAAFGQFLRVGFPGSIWRIRWFVVAATVLTFAPALAMGTWVATSDAALDAAAPEEVRDAYVSEEFEAYYSSDSAGAFTGYVTLNNIQVAFVAFASGIAACAGTVLILVSNGANVGVAGGLFHAAGEPGHFWWLILPHGLLELTAVVLAGAAGLRLGWTIIDPGDRTRGEGLAEEGRRSVTVVIGLIGAFVVAGLIEGFVTGSSLPTVVRVGTGVVVEVAFLAYLWVFGRVAVEDEEESGYGAVVARRLDGAAGAGAG